MSRETKDRLALRMEPETKQKIDQWYATAGCRSRNQFVEEAVNFYADHLAVGHSDDFLPNAVLTAINGRLGVFENRLASLQFKQAVEQNVANNILAAISDVDEATYQHLRGKSVRQVMETKGSVSLKDAIQHQREAW